MDHLVFHREKFCLRLLRYLVLDEADRLLNDFRQDWLAEIEEAVYNPEINVCNFETFNEFNSFDNYIQFQFNF